MLSDTHSVEGPPEKAKVSRIDAVIQGGPEAPLFLPASFPEKLSEPWKIGEAHPSKRPLPEPGCKVPPKRTMDRNDPDRLAAQYRLGRHRDAVARDVDFVGFGQEHCKAGTLLDDGFLSVT